MKEILDQKDSPFIDEEEIYQYVGSGAADPGKAYMLNEGVVLEHFKSIYDASIAETK